MKTEHYVSISRRQLRGKTRFRVALKYFSGDLNALDRTLDERMFRSQSAAENQANNWARHFAARIVGLG